MIEVVVPAPLRGRPFWSAARSGGSGGREGLEAYAMHILARATATEEALDSRDEVRLAPGRRGGTASPGEPPSPSPAPASTRGAGCSASRSDSRLGNARQGWTRALTRCYDKSRRSRAGVRVSGRPSDALEGARATFRAGGRGEGGEVGGEEAPGRKSRCSPLSAPSPLRSPSGSVVRSPFLWGDRHAPLAGVHDPADLPSRMQTHTHTSIFGPRVTMHSLLMFAISTRRGEKTLRE